jgi:hypothetical protein
VSSHLGPLDRQPINIRPPFDVRRPPIHDLPANLADFLEALNEPLVGIPLGTYEERIIRWLAGWDTSTVGAVVSLLHRARAAAPLGGAR